MPNRDVSKDPIIRKCLLLAEFTMFSRGRWIMGAVSLVHMAHGPYGLHTPIHIHIYIYTYTHTHIHTQTYTDRFRDFFVKADLFGDR